MKLFLADFKKTHSFDLPNKVTDNFYILQFDLFYNDNLYNKDLTLKYNDDGIFIESNEVFKIVFDGKEVPSLQLKENTIFFILFGDILEYFPVYVLPSLTKYLPLNIGHLNKVVIGNNKDANIKFSAPNESIISLNRVENSWYLYEENVGQFGCYLNNFVSNNSELRVGDVIFFYGVKIIFMGTYVLVYNFLYTFSYSNVTEISLHNENYKVAFTPVNETSKNVSLYNESQLFTHKPRVKNSIKKAQIKFEEPPAKVISQKVPAIFSLGSSSVMMVTSGMSLIGAFRNHSNGTLDTFGFITEIVGFGAMFIASLFIPMLMNKWEKISEQKNEKKRVLKYTSYLEEKGREIESTISSQEDILRLQYVDYEHIQSCIMEKSPELWSRDIIDDDFLDVVVGVGDIPADIEITGISDSFSIDDDAVRKTAVEISNGNYFLKKVPVVYSIAKNKVMPCIIFIKDFYDYVKSIMLQIIYYHSAKDLKIVVVTNEYNEKQWDYLSMTAYTWDNNYENRFFSTSENDLQQISMLLEKEYETRVNAQKNDKNVLYNEHYLIVSDDYKMLKNLSIVEKILESNENYGFSVMIFENSFSNLPSRFANMVSVFDGESSIVNKNDMSEERITFEPLYVKNLDIDKYSKEIASIPVTLKNGDTDIPSSLSFLDMFKVGNIEQLNILQNWSNNNPTISLKTIIGIKQNGKQVDLDLHEKAHGPHGLIAGSTGSGKSEFIITFILSMAINYHPYEVQFVLIDYKGGGLAGAFENKDTGVKLPHLVGTITNLDKSEMNRSLVSIKSELQRRQKIFNETRDKLEEGTVDIYKYQRFYREGKVSFPLSHLFIISDEFAELKQQQPEFMDELVSAARIGRSLGIHLILATQKPAGVVDDQIWSNSRFKISLKVQSEEDSLELLKRPDAAYIKEAGRFYLQVGTNEIWEMGQSGWSGAKYIPSLSLKKNYNDDIIFLSNTGNYIKVVNDEVKKEEQQDMGDQLTNIVKYLDNLGEREKIATNKLWLDNVPNIIVYQDIVNKYQYKAEKYIINPLIGEYDDPSNQKQSFVTLPLHKGGNTWIVGSTGSGKTTLLTTMIYSIISNHPSSEVNIYILDLAGEKLKIFQKAPQIGDVLTSQDADKIKFLFYLLKDERDKRINYYTKNGGDFTKDILDGQGHFPSIVVIINDISIFNEMYEDLYDTEFASFTRNCTKVGIYFIITSNVSSGLGYVVENNFNNRIVLQMNDESEYSDIFTNPPIPSNNPGRGLIQIDDVYQFQVALPFEEDLIEKKLAIVVNELDKALIEQARRIPVIPDEIRVEELAPKISKLDAVPLGVNVKTAQYGFFNFNNIVNVITTRSIDVTKTFFSKFSKILSYLKNENIIVLNCFTDYDFTVPEKVKYFNTGFNKLISTFAENIDKCIATPKEVSFVVVIIGYMELQKHLLEKKEEDEDTVTVDDILLKAKEINNFKFILYDIESNMRDFEKSPAYDLFKKNTGLWIGKDFDDQSLFETNSSYYDMSLSKNNIVIVSNGNVEVIKY